MLARDLGRPWTREDGGPFMHVAEDTAGDSDRRLCSVLRTWVGTVLRPWAEGLDLDEALVDGIDDACDPGQAFTKEHGQSDLLRLPETAQDFDRLRHPVLQEVSRRLEGLELFPAWAESTGSSGGAAAATRCSSSPGPRWPSRVVVTRWSPPSRLRPHPIWDVRCSPCAPRGGAGWTTCRPRPSCTAALTDRLSYGPVSGRQ